MPRRHLHAAPGVAGRPGRLFAQCHPPGEAGLPRVHDHADARAGHGHRRSRRSPSPHRVRPSRKGPSSSSLSTTPIATTSTTRCPCSGACNAPSPSMSRPPLSTAWARCGGWPSKTSLPRSTAIAVTYLGETEYLPTATLSAEAPRLREHLLAHAKHARGRSGRADPGAWRAVRPRSRGALPRTDHGLERSAGLRQRATVHAGRAFGASLRAVQAGRDGGEQRDRTIRCG